MSEKKSDVISKCQVSQKRRQTEAKERGMAEKGEDGTSLAVQWFLGAFTAGGAGSISGRGRAHMRQGAAGGKKRTVLATRCLWGPLSFSLPSCFRMAHKEVMWA